MQQESALLRLAERQAGREEQVAQAQQRARQAEVRVEDLQQDVALLQQQVAALKEVSPLLLTGHCPHHFNCSCVLTQSSDDNSALLPYPLHVQEGLPAVTVFLKEFLPCSYCRTHLRVLVGLCTFAQAGSPLPPVLLPKYLQQLVATPLHPI